MTSGDLIISQLAWSAIRLVPAPRSAFPAVAPGLPVLAGFKELTLLTYA
jgi:hypothetical protein